MARIDAAYNYFLTTYGKDLGNRYESHKKSELRSTYNSILKTNKESPLFKIADTEDVAKFAIDVKESANSLHNAVSYLTENGEDISSMLDKKVATSSDEDVVLAKYVGSDDSADTPSFKLKVKQLATPQVNTGRFLNPMAQDFEEGSYSFDLDTQSNSYEFQFNVGNRDTNLEVQQKISRLVNNSDIGLRAEIITNDKNQTALSISSKQTGLAENEEFLFSIKSSTAYDELNKLGIDKVTAQAANSVFELNGREHSSLSNTFTINKAFEVTLNSASDKTVEVGFKADTDAIADGLDELLMAYNGMVEVGMKYSSAHSNNKLYNEITAIGKNMSESLASVGIESDDNGKLSLDREKLGNAITGESKDDSYRVLNNFKDAISRQSKKASINPMNYVNKIIVEYKNPGKTLAHPYAPSAFAGMLVDRAL